MLLKLKDFILHLEREVTLEEGQFYRMVIEPIARGVLVEIERRPMGSDDGWTRYHRCRAEIMPFGEKKQHMNRQIIE